MLPGISYEVAQSIQADRLQQADHWRLLKTIKATATRQPRPGWSLGFRRKRLPSQQLYLQTANK